MSWTFLLVSAGLVAIALAGTFVPMTRPRRILLERLPDPLEDKKDALLRSLADLDEERATGALREEDYRTLRVDTERRAVAVLKEIASRDGGDGLRDRLGEIRPRGEGTSSSPSRRWVAATVVTMAVVVATVPMLAGSLRARSPDQAITGDLGTGASSGGTDPLSFFEQRVAQNPNDLAARLDLAYRYLSAGRLPDAITQYEAALRLDPKNPEAHAELGFILFLADRPKDGLDQVDLALTRDPEYPQGLFIKGVILLQGLGRRGAARAALESYLRAAPFGAERATAEKLLGKIDDQRP